MACKSTDVSQGHRISAIGLVGDEAPVMADNLTRKARSELMSSVRSKGNKSTEQALRRVLRQHKVAGWRSHVVLRVCVNQLPPPGSVSRRVTPDFVFARERVVVFVDGCFWHGCPRHGRLPKSNRSKWVGKLNANQKRDHLVRAALKADGWKVIRIWEHAIARAPTECAKRVSRAVEARRGRCPKKT